MDDEDLISLPQSKQCLCCKQIKGIDRFHEYTKGKDGYYPHCVTCEARKNNQRMQQRRPSQRKKYAAFMMKALHLTGKDY